MKSNIGRLILLALCCFIIFKTVLKLHHLKFPNFIFYLITLWGIILIFNNFWKESYGKKLALALDGKENSVHKVTAIATGVNFILLTGVFLLFKVADTLLIGFSEISFTYIKYCLTNSFSAAFFCSLLIYLYYYTYFTSVDKKSSITEQKIITGNVSAQFESLKNQLDPHFLFNSLNVLNSLIEENPENAQEFTHGLSKTYRYILDQKDKELVPLSEELDFAKTYIELLQVRFEESLTYEIDTSAIKDITDLKIVPLSLQLLLENVIKHNKASTLKPLHITIKIESIDYLLVQNNLNLRKITEERNGIGLENIASRYALLTGRPIKIEQTETDFNVRIPLLTQIISPMRIIDVQENEQDLLIKAKKKVEDIKKFYAHLTSYIMVNTFLIFLNLLTSDEFMWSLIVVFAWGIGLVSHAMQVYNYNFFLGKDWEDKKIREYMEKNKKKDNWN